jgi:site-specific DNA-methyltransferase (adenine-specific)
LVSKIILNFSKKGDLILDPFMGSGTTAKMALKNQRNFIGFELSQEYCDIAEKRIEPWKEQTRLF